MRRVLPAFVLLAFGLACSGTVQLPLDAPADDDGTEADGDGDDEDGDEDADGDDDEEPEERDVAQATPDCTVDMMGVLVGLPGYGGDKKDQAKSPVAIHKGPSEKSKVVGEYSAKGLVPAKKDEPFCHGTTGDDACVGATVALEQFGLPVYQVKDGWAMVGMGKGGNILGDGSCQRRVWVQTTEKLVVRDVVDLLDTDMAYLRGGMPPKLFDDAAGEPLAEQPEDSSDDISARVIRHKEVDGRIWVKVELYDQSPCEGEQEEVAEGWMPLHDDAGRLQFWFYSDC